jgi:hypothetical protein
LKTELNFGTVTDYEFALQLGFFKRSQKEEMERLTKENTHAAASDTEDE